MGTSAGWRSVLLERLAARDGGLCQICGRKLDRRIKNKRSPWLVTVDHIIPVSRGGGGQVSNLRLAHRQCNQDRGNTPIQRKSPIREVCA